MVLIVEAPHAARCLLSPLSARTPEGLKPAQSRARLGAPRVPSQANATSRARSRSSALDTARETWVRSVAGLLTDLWLEHEMGGEDEIRVHGGYLPNRFRG